MLDVVFEGIDNLENGDEVSVSGDDFAVDGLAAVRTGNLLIGVDFDEFLHAGSAARMLVDAHHHRRVLALVELAQAQEALRLHLTPDQALDLFAHQIAIDQLHSSN